MSILNELYSEKKSLLVKFAECENKFSINLSSEEYSNKASDFIKRPDCKIFSWTANKWFRTPKGENYKKYESFGNLKQAINLSAKARGLSVEYFEVE